MSFVSVSTSTYTRTHTAAFVSDKLRALLRRLVRDYGFNPEKLLNSWTDWVDEAARTWLVSGHLEKVVIEFYKPGSDYAEARWDFPIAYDGDADDQDLWVDYAFFENSIAKGKRPPSGCTYRILLVPGYGAPNVPGLSTVQLKSVTHLTARTQGTVMSTPDIMASVRTYS
ncbi:hypothetical protein [Hyphomonas sp. KY3]|uniref:hypothetical protein n=1 Tax=Hyphomonas sp. KY3 TaxID=2016196 RepID=UPI001A8FB295|nr:hypothetical protein [Hyphomonas sp. KY3]QSR22032.1 hypothetical protein CFA77_06955 [Hyphomonas sp. KY3]|tara:strand:- start:5380 stop:5889 length:510 start_codon:yes stop_codon:yes gene_type:complete